jgi:uncharacterized protein YrzB (UPF0473 family)
MNKYVVASASELISCTNEIYSQLEEELRQDWKTFSITIDDIVYDINSYDHETRNTVIKLLLKDAFSAYLESMDNDKIKPFEVIYRILNGARKEDHQIEIIKETYTPDLDDQGNPIKAKPLNVDSIYVQWQDESKYGEKMSEDDYQDFLNKVKEKRPEVYKKIMAIED